MADGPRLDFDWVAQQVTRSGERTSRILVAVDGPGASGKRTLAVRLADRLDQAMVVQSGS